MSDITEEQAFAAMQDMKSNASTALESGHYTKDELIEEIENLDE